MKLLKGAIAGTLESSDCQVMVEPGNNGVQLSLESTVINQYGDQIKKVVMEVIERLDVQDVNIAIVDKGALDCTIKARVEGAVFRGAQVSDNLPWKGIIQ